VQSAIESACLFTIAWLFGGRGIASHDIALRNQTGEDKTVCAKEEDRVYGDEKRAEDAGDNGLPCYANVGADSSEEEVEGCDKCSGECGATDVLLLEHTIEDDGERDHADAGKLIGWEGCVTECISMTYAVESGGTYAKEKLLRSTLTTKTIDSGSTCLAIWTSNSNRPPPAIPPEPCESQRPIDSRMWFLLPPRYAPPCGATGKEGATAGPKPSQRRGRSRARVRLEKPMRRMCVIMSWRKVHASGKGNLRLLKPAVTLKRLNFLLVNARQHNEAVHEQQPKAASANPKHKQCNPDLPSHPC
jgi:hypothetical protein